MTLARKLNSTKVVCFRGKKADPKWSVMCPLLEVGNMASCEGMPLATSSTPPFAAFHCLLVCVLTQTCRALRACWCHSSTSCLPGLAFLKPGGAGGLQLGKTKIMASAFLPLAVGFSNLTTFMAKTNTIDFYTS